MYDASMIGIGDTATDKVAGACMDVAGFLDVHRKVSPAPEVIVRTTGLVELSWQLTGPDQDQAVAAIIREIGAPSWDTDPALYAGDQHTWTRVDLGGPRVYVESKCERYWWLRGFTLRIWFDRARAIEANERTKREEPK